MSREEHELTVAHHNGLSEHRRLQERGRAIMSVEEYDQESVAAGIRLAAELVKDHAVEERVSVDSVVTFLTARADREARLRKDPLTPREQFETKFGSIDEDQWQWLKEFVRENVQKTRGELSS